MRSYLLWGGLAVWLILASVAIYSFGGSNFKEFDPHLRLASQIMSLDFEKDLLQAMESSGLSTDEARIYHVRSGDCWCDALSKPHAQKIDQWATQYAVNAQVIDLAKHPSLAEYIPSTPAVIVVDQEQLVYFGPYSEGMGCFAQTGFVDIRMKPYFENPRANFTASIQTEAIGCYCHQ